MVIGEDMKVEKKVLRSSRYSEPISIASILTGALSSRGSYRRSLFQKVFAYNIIVH